MMCPIFSNITQQKTHSVILLRLVLTDIHTPRNYLSFQKFDSESISNYPKYFFALCRTRVSNTWLLIGVCAVWKGFIIVYGESVIIFHTLCLNEN